MLQNIYLYVMCMCVCVGAVYVICVDGYMLYTRASKMGYILWDGSENDDAERRNTHEFVTKFPSKIKPINDSNFNFGK